MNRVFLILIFVLIFIGCGDNTSEIESKHIPGISPSDIYLNFEKKGYNTQKNIASDGSFWINEKRDNGMYYYIRTYCADGVSNVDAIRLSVTREYPQYNKVNDMKPFLKYGCSIPYDGSDYNSVLKFIDNNFNNDKADTVISDVKFTIYAPTKFSRVISIEK